MITRRRALSVLATGAAALAAYRVLPPSRSATLPSVRELALSLFQSFDPATRALACVAYDHPLRQYHNRGVPGGGVHVFALAREQRRMTTDLLYAGLSETGRARVPNEYFTRFPGVHLMKVLFCGDPTSAPYQVLLTGPHLNLRLGGTSREGVAFGGPQVYGDQRGDGEAGLPGNLYAFQLDLGRRLFASMTDAERQRALLPAAPIQTQIELRDASEPRPGVPIAELSAESRQAAEAVVLAMLSTYSEEDADYARRCLTANGGVAAMAASFYRDGEVNGSGVYQIFRLEGPAAVFYFRGAPHVHAFVNVAMDPSAPLSVGELLGENPTPLEGAAVRRLFERAMRESSGADVAYFEADGVVGRLRRGPVRSGDIYNLESWQDRVHVEDIDGARLPPEIARALREQGVPFDARRTYRVARAKAQQLAALESGGTLLRDATIAYVRTHGFAAA